MTRILFFIFFYLVLIYNLTYFILYINLLSFGYTITDYLLFLFSKPYPYMVIISLLICSLLIYRKKETKK